MDAGVEQHGGIFAIGHAERLGAGKAGERDLARRRLPGPRMRLLPAEMPPTRAAIERRSPIVTDAKTGKSRAAICWRHARGRLLSAAYQAKSVPAALPCRRRYTGVNRAAATRRSSASSTL